VVFAMLFIWLEAVLGKSLHRNGGFRRIGSSGELREYAYTSTTTVKSVLRGRQC
jgi:hypothetical protein